MTVAGSRALAERFCVLYGKRKTRDRKIKILELFNIVFLKRRQDVKDWETTNTCTERR